MRVAVYGRTGWVGRALEPALAAAGHVVSDPTGMEPDAAIYLVSTARPADAEKNFEDVMAAEESLLKAALDQLPDGVPFIFASSGGSVYADSTQPHLESEPLAPLSAYGRCKMNLEILLAGRHERPVTVARLANLYGPWPRERAPFGVINTFADRIARGQELLIFGDADIVRDFVHIDDVCMAFLKMIDAGRTPGIYNIASGRATSLSRIVEAFESLHAVAVRREPGRAFDVKSNVLDIERACRVLGWSPRTDLIGGLAATLEWRLSWA